VHSWKKSEAAHIFYLFDTASNSLVIGRQHSILHQHIVAAMQELGLDLVQFAPVLAPTSLRCRHRGSLPARLL